MTVFRKGQAGGGCVGTIIGTLLGLFLLSYLASGGNPFDLIGAVLSVFN